jgi:spore coat protein CotH
MIRTLFFILLFLFFYIHPAEAQEKGFYDLYHIPEIKLYFEQDDWVERLEEMKKGEGGRIEARLLIDGEEYEEVGARFKGNSSFNRASRSESSKLPWNIKLNHRQKKQSLPDGQQKIKLANVFGDPSFLREILAYDLARQYMPAPQANFAKVFVNDEYVGLYSNTEAVDEAFLESRFDEKKGVLFKCDPQDWEEESPEKCKEGEYSSLAFLGTDSVCYYPYYELKSKTGWKELIQLARALEKEKGIEDWINVDMTLWMHAFNNAIVNLDSYSGLLCHNYYLYRDATGRFYPLIWDLNLAFGGFRRDGAKKGSLSVQEMMEMSPFLHFRNEKRPLISKLLANPRYRKWYVAHLRTIYEENFANGKLLEQARDLEQFVRYYVQTDKNQLYSFEDFQKNFNETIQVDGLQVAGLTELIKGRSEHLGKHPLLTLPRPTIDPPLYYSLEDRLIVSCKVADATSVSLFYRTMPGENFQELAMLDDGQHDDGEAGDGMFGISLEYLKGTEFYIVAENEKTARFEPSAAPYKAIRAD